MSNSPDHLIHSHFTSIPTTSLAALPVSSNPRFFSSNSGITWISFKKKKKKKNQTKPNPEVQKYINFKSIQKLKTSSDTPPSSMLCKNSSNQSKENTLRTTLSTCSHPFFWSEQIFNCSGQNKTALEMSEFPSQNAL